MKAVVWHGWIAWVAGLSESTAKRVKVSDTPKRHKKVVPMNVVADYWMNVFSGTPDQQTQGSTETKPLASNVICMEAFKKLRNSTGIEPHQPSSRPDNHHTVIPANAGILFRLCRRFEMLKQVQYDVRYICEMPDHVRHDVVFIETGTQSSRTCFGISFRIANRP